VTLHGGPAFIVASLLTCNLLVAAQMPNSHAVLPTDTYGFGRQPKTVLAQGMQHVEALAV